jgi:hypothetical protein
VVTNGDDFVVRLCVDLRNDARREIQPQAQIAPRPLAEDPAAQRRIA